MKVSPFDSPGKRGKNTAFPPKARNQTLTRGMRRLFPFAYKDVTPPIAPRCPFLVRPYRHPPSYSLNAPTRYVFLISVLEWSRSLTHLFLPSLTVVSPCRALPFKNSLEEISFPPWEEGRGSFEGNSIFAISPDRLSPESGGKRLPPFVFPVRFPPLRLFSLLAVSSFLPTLSSVYFSFLFLPFFLFFVFVSSFSFFLSLFLSPFYFRRSIERELGSVFSLRTFSRSQLLPSSSFEDDCFLGSNPWYLDTF